MAKPCELLIVRLVGVCMLEFGVCHLDMLAFGRCELRFDVFHLWTFSDLYNDDYQ